MSDLTKFGIGIGDLDVVRRGVGVQVERALVPLEVVRARHFRHLRNIPGFVIRLDVFLLNNGNGWEFKSFQTFVIRHDVFLLNSRRGCEFFDIGRRGITDHGLDHLGDWEVGCRFGQKLTLRRIGVGRQIVGHRTGE